MLQFRGWGEPRSHDSSGLLVVRGRLSLGAGSVPWPGGVPRWPGISLARPHGIVRCVVSSTSRCRHGCIQSRPTGRPVTSIPVSTAICLPSRQCGGRREVTLLRLLAPFRWPLMPGADRVADPRPARVLSLAVCNRIVAVSRAMPLMAHQAGRCLRRLRPAFRQGVRHPDRHGPGLRGPPVDQATNDLTGGRARSRLRADAVRPLRA